MEQRLIGKYKSTEETESEDVTTREYSAEEVVESMKWGRFHVSMLFLAGVFVMVESLEVMLLTVLFPVIQCEWQLSSFQAALLSIVVFTGMFCGAPFWGMLSDKHGRKPVVFMATALVSYIGLLGAFSPNIYWLYFLRFLVGFGIAGGIHMGVLLIEFIGSKYRATTVITMQGFWATGASLEVFLAWAVISTLGWRYLIGFSAIPIMLFLLTWTVIPESARFLLVSGQSDKAISTLARIAKRNRCSLPTGKLQAQVVEERGRLRDLFQPEYRRTTLQVLYVWATVTSTYYGTSLATTELISINYCGSPNDQAPSNHSSKACGCTPLSSSDYGHIAVTAIAEILVMPVAIILADLLGRRRALSICLAVVALSYYVQLSCVGSTWGVTVLLFIARGFAASSSTILHLYVPEVFPTQIRAIGTSSGYFAGRLGAMMSPLISQVLLRTSVHAALLVYAIMCTVSSILALLFPIETKGRRMQ